MKITIENLEDSNLKLTLNFKGKDYSETWTVTGKGSYATTGRSIITQLEIDGITAEDTDIDDFLTSIVIPDFMNLAENEEEWQ